MSEAAPAASMLQGSPIHPIRLPHITLANNLVLAPMAGVSNLPFRLIAREAGASLTFTETVSAKGLVHGGPKTWRLLRTTPREAPVAFQLFGSEPTVLSEACLRLADQGAVWIDLNMGCPVRKFIRNRAGSALLRDPRHVAQIVRAMRRSFPGTLSVKMRSGWDARCLNAPEVARISVAEGAELVSVHGRTREQQYTGRADRGVIRRVVEAVPEVPVLANGDVVRASDVFEMLRETGAAGVMIGRGAMGNPWIFQHALDLARGTPAREPTPAERLALIERHVGLMESCADDRERLAQNLKKYLVAYSRGLPRSGEFRERTHRAEKFEEMLTLTRRYFSERAKAA